MKTTMLKTMKNIGMTAMFAGSVAVAGSAFADELPSTAATTMKQIFPQAKMDAAKKMPVRDLYEARYGSEVFYVSSDGKYLVKGEIMDVSNNVNLTQKSIQKARKAKLANIRTDEMIIYKPKDTKAALTIFTDVDCPYCRKMHAERQQLLDAGVELRYMLFPRTGLNSSSGEKAISIWCSSDRSATMTKAKEGKEIEDKICKTPLENHMRIAIDFGLVGTPHLVLEDGRTFSGYYPPAQIIHTLINEAK